jgi:iron(III) transport system ATP-binding protein
MTDVRLSHITKRFDATVALDDINLEIGKGELFFLLGPSGCGKSTLLRVIAGLMEPTSGRLFFNGRDVTDLATQQRNAVMCFQSYALWPHMTVWQNVVFGLGVRGISGSEQKKRVEEALSLVRMDALAERRPGQLSGGQQQRVALARAMAVRPDCLLLDEPLSNLDAKLRIEMRAEIRRICKSAGFTTLYVTHDQQEALSVADRVAVLKDGKVIQTGPPAEMYLRPRTSFVADFLGQTNLIAGEVIGRNGLTISVQTALGVVNAEFDGTTAPQKVIVSVRPERIRIANGGSKPSNQFAAKIVETTFLGESSEHVLAVNGKSLRMTCAPPVVDAGGEVTIEFDAEDALALLS